MLIETIIKPRRDGTVRAAVNDGTVYVFTQEDDRLVCDVANQDHADSLLALGNFFPADEDLIQEAPPLEGGSLAEMLANMDKSGLIEYAKQNAVDGVDARMSVATLRQKIAEALSV